MKKKIVFIVEALGGGVRRHLLDLLDNLDTNNYNIHVIYGTRTDDVFVKNIEKLKNKGIGFYQITSMQREISFNQDFKSFKSIYKILKGLKPDIVHCHSSKAGAIGRLCAKILKIKQIYYTPHAYAFMDPSISRFKYFMYIYIEKVLSKVTTKVIHVSKGEEEEAIQRRILMPNKSMVVFNGLSIEGELSNNVKKGENFIIGTVARMDDQKNPMEFVKIAERVISKNRAVKFVYVGDGIKFREIQQYVNESDFKENIILLGFHNNPFKILGTFDVFLTTSLYEGLPYSLIEALASKLPIVATNVTGNNEVVDNNNNGYLYRQGDIEEAAKLIESLIKDNMKLNEFALNSYKFYSSQFLLDKMMNSYDLIYNGTT
ncbi:glycosyltransferase [Priestia aryabhattai]|uniref:Glycosyltransferase n=1 Tax=Priestia aryabhattai TaxID=412384 RepID=A0ABD5KNI0_PRIAR|nr:glycosyltransferase [Priestia aryabhattai]MBY0006616.1 glycosyltransferase [Priestia aryabhattai]MBY0047280.1 glycosyltransferase [Priestia aryabhattai]